MLGQPGGLAVVIAHGLGADVGERRDEGFRRSWGQSRTPCTPPPCGPHTGLFRRLVNQRRLAPYTGRPPPPHTHTSPHPDVNQLVDAQGTPHPPMHRKTPPYVAPP